MPRSGSLTGGTMVAPATTVTNKTGDRRGPAGGKATNGAAATQPKGGITLSSGNSERISILLVDDDADCRLLIRDAIAECKVSNCVFEVATGQEALDFL